MVIVSKELEDMRKKQMNEVCHRSKDGRHSFIFDHWCCCNPACEDNVHRQCEVCCTSEENRAIDE